MKLDRSIALGWALSGLFTLFLLFASALPKLARMPVAERTLTDLGWPSGYAFPIGLVELAGILLYLYGRTNVLGAILLTGLLGGAMATHLRAASPLASHTLFGIYLGIFMWGGLWLRDPRLRSIFPWRSPEGHS